MGFAGLIVVIFIVFFLVMIGLAGVMWVIFDRKRNSREPR